MRTLLIALFLMALAATGASARDVPKHATLANPAKQNGFVAGSIAWRCDGTACTTASDLVGAGAKSMCRDLAKVAGPITTFEGLDAAQLEKCNEAAKH